MACANAATPSTVLSQADAEAAVLCLINEQRAANGAPPLTLNLKLRAAARQHANDARTLKWWAGGGPKIHVNPLTQSKPHDRIKGAGYCPAEASCPTNENGFASWYRGGLEYQGLTAPQAALDFWMNSSGHRDTLLDPSYNETGVAVVLGVAEKGTDADNADGGVIVVQTFGGCSKPEAPALGVVRTWGYNNHGALGDGTTVDRHAPVTPKPFGEPVAIAGGGYHTLALVADGAVWSWGWNQFGQLGDGTLTEQADPTPVHGLGSAAAIAAGGYHSLALLPDGTVAAWGLNHDGQLGDGTTDDRRDPVQVAGLSDAIAISAGHTHSLAVAADGAVFAWGDNDEGQLGDGTQVDRSIPQQVTRIGRAIAVSAGFDHSLALLADGSVWAWGANSSGQLGDGTTTPHLSPVQVAVLDAQTGPIVAVAAGGVHNLALEQSGWVWAWGGNAYGELGTGDTLEQRLPVRVRGTQGTIAVAAGFGHSHALRQNGSVWSWGCNTWGQVGDTTTDDRWEPVRVLGPSRAVGVAAGLHHSLAL